MSTKTLQIGMVISRKPDKSGLNKGQILNWEDLEGQKIKIVRFTKPGDIVEYESPVSGRPGSSTYWIEYIRVDEGGKGNKGYVSPHDIVTYFGLKCPHFGGRKKRNL